MPVVESMRSAQKNARLPIIMMSGVFKNPKTAVEAREKYLRFATDPATLWPGNFRDFSGSVRRLCTLAPRGRITRVMVDEEMQNLQADWRNSSADPDFQLVSDIMGEAASEVDPFDMVQLAHVIRTCRASQSLSAAGRSLFAVSRAKRTTQNDADRLRKYLQKFALNWDAVTVDRSG